MGLCFLPNRPNAGDEPAVFSKKQYLPRPERGGGQVLFFESPWPGSEGAALCRRSCFVGDPVPVRAHCPHCITPCQVAEQHLGVPVRCHKCGQAFTVQPTALTSKPPTTEPIPQTAGALRLDISGVTSIGRERSRNEDSFLVQHLTWSDLNENHQLALVIVADGMGGHAGGDQAARLALRTIGIVLAPLLTGALNTQQREVTRAGLANSIDTAIKEANSVVQHAATKDRRYKGMGATAAVVVIWNGRVVIGHVGDCRVYHYHVAHMKQVTRDQTLVNRMVELGQLNPEEAADHPASNQVLQAIGTRTTIEPARYKLKLVPGDWLLVACDGLHGQVDDRTIQTTVSKAPPSSALLACRLVDLADQSGGADNCTVVAVRCY
jgi:protein phosphatase